MKIVHVTSVHTPLDRRIFWKQAISCKNANHEVHLIVASNQQKSGLIDGVHIHVLKKIENRSTRVFINGFRVFVKTLSIKANVFHFHDPELIPWFLLLKFSGRHVVMDVHEDYPAQIKGKKWLQPFFRQILSYFIFLLENIATKIFDGIVVADSLLADSFKVKSTKTPIIVANNYPLINQNISKINITLEKYTSNRILFLGGINRARCSEEFVMALGDINNNEYEVLMGGNENNNELLSRIRILKGWSQVKFLGTIPPGEVDSIMIKSSISINIFSNLPNQTGIRSNRLFEAMAAGLPVIVSDFPNIKEFIEKYQCGIAVDPNNHREISKAINALLQDPEYAMELGLNGRKAVLKKFRWEMEFKKISNLYNQICYK
jgi:glycosyltransferase involved in cell wall biosynthesis